MFDRVDSPRLPRRGVLQAPERPKTRGDCVSGPRPCPWVSCRHHLGVDVLGTEVRERAGWDEVDALGRPLRPSCSLDVADDGPQPIEPIARALGVSARRVDQLLKRAVRRAWSRAPHGDIREHLLAVLEGADIERGHLPNGRTSADKWLH